MLISGLKDHLNNGCPSWYSKFCSKTMVIPSATNQTLVFERSGYIMLCMGMNKPYNTWY